MRLKHAFASLSEDTKKKILKTLQQAHPCDLCIKEVARKTKISAVTASTYLKVLVASNEVEVSRKFGKLAFYRLKVSKKRIRGPE
jgi:response regulator of citrate/malate metabolism